MRRTRLEPPKSLGKGAALVFGEIVASADPEHFQRSDLSLLVQYAVACDLASQAQRAIDADGAVIMGKSSPWIVILEKAHRSMVALSARLRLSPQSRLDRKSAGLSSPVPGSRGIETLLEYRK